MSVWDVAGRLLQRSQVVGAYADFPVRRRRLTPRALFVERTESVGGSCCSGIGREALAHFSQWPPSREPAFLAVSRDGRSVAAPLDKQSGSSMLTPSSESRKRPMRRTGSTTPPLLAPMVAGWPPPAMMAGSGLVG